MQDLFLVVGLLVAASACCLAVAPYRPSPKQQVSPEVAVQAHSFPLSRVELLDGLFKRAEQRDAQYLLRLEPDRFLAWFRKRAGLEPRGKVYGGWESDEIAGHCLGHYLSACSMMYAVTGDERLRDRVDYIVDELALCQAEHGDGYVAAIPGGKESLLKAGRGQIDARAFDLNGIWVPWYTLHKELAGLRDAYLYCDSDKAREVAKKLADWSDRTTSDMSDAEWQKMLSCEHGGMNEVLADLYALSGQKRYLELARKFYDRSILDPLSEGKDVLPGHHSNTQVPKLIGLSRLYELTRDEKYRDAARFFWNTVVHHHTYVNGGNSAEEYFGQPGQLADRLKHTTETCNTYNMLKLTRHLFAWEPDAELMDYYERALYNHILASQHPETGMMKYKGYLEMPARKGFSTPFDSFWCCVGTGMENHARYAESIYFHDNDTLFWNLFIASRLDWRGKGVVVRQQNDFPGTPVSRLEFECEQPTDLTVKVRHPSWCEEMTVTVNGSQEMVSSRPGRYVAISRTWKSGDTVELHLPMTLDIETMPNNENRLAFRYGPVVLAAELGDEEPVPVLFGDPAVVRQAFVREGPDELRFIARAAGWASQDDGSMKPCDVRLMPLYAIADQKYTVYMDRLPGEIEKVIGAARSNSLLKDQRKAAIKLLGSLDYGAEQAVPALQKLKSGAEDEEIKKQAGEALKNVQRARR